LFTSSWRSENIVACISLKKLQCSFSRRNVFEFFESYPSRNKSSLVTWLCVNSKILVLKVFFRNIRWFQTG
jgi:hypothetical protein